MADIALVTANRVHVVQSYIQLTLPAGEAIVAGAPVRIDVTSGRFMNSNGTTAPEARTYGVATKGAVSGEGLTAIKKGIMDGFDFAALAYDLPIYTSDTDGRLADAAGTVSKQVGRIIPGAATQIGVVYDRLLEVDL